MPHETERIAELERELALARGAMAAQDEREQIAGARCGVPRELYGCDWPDVVADALLEAQGHAVDARAELAEQQQLCRELAQALERELAHWPEIYTDEQAAAVALLARTRSYRK